MRKGIGQRDNETKQAVSRRVRTWVEESKGLAENSREKNEQVRKRKWIRKILQ